jgi:hypothetical protein
MVSGCSIRTVHASQFNAMGPGRLYLKSSDISIGYINQNHLSALDIAFLNKMQYFKSSNWNGSGSFMGHIGQFNCQHQFIGQTFYLDTPIYTPYPWCCCTRY